MKWNHGWILNFICNEHVVYDQYKKADEFCELQLQMSTTKREVLPMLCAHDYVASHCSTVHRHLTILSDRFHVTKTSFKKLNVYFIVKRHLEFNAWVLLLCCIIFRGSFISSMYLFNKIVSESVSFSDYILFKCTTLCQHFSIVSFHLNLILCQLLCLVTVVLVKGKGTGKRIIWEED